MTSLRTVLPAVGSVSWRAEPATPNASVAEADALLQEMRVRHVVIREAHIYSDPKPHVLYQIEVMTQADQWTVLRRYSEFHQLQSKMSKLHAVKKDLLPSKRLTGNLSQSVIEQRREALERYLQRLINGDKEVVFSPPLLEFLDVNKHNVVAVTNKLAKHLKDFGEEIIRQDMEFHMTPTQCRCVSRRLRLPLSYQNPSLLNAVPVVGAVKEEPVDLSHLYDFVYNLPKLSMHPAGSKEHGSATFETVAADLSVFKSLRLLRTSHCAVRALSGLNALQPGLETLSCQHGGLASMKELVRDAVAERRAPPKATTRTESWRSAALGRLIESRALVRPWLRLTTLDLSHNSITEVDPGCLGLMPALEQLILSHNLISNIDEWLRKGAKLVTLHRLRRLDLGHNSLFSLFAQADEATTSASSSLPSSPVRDSFTRQSFGNLKISPGWGLSESLPSSLSGAGMAESKASSDSDSDVARSRADSRLRPTPQNTSPPSYDSAHLISTDHPDASLAELQRLRSLRLRQENGTAASDPGQHGAGDEDSDAADPPQGGAAFNGSANSDLGSSRTDKKARKLSVDDVTDLDLDLEVEDSGEDNDDKSGNSFLGHDEEDADTAELEFALSQQGPKVRGHIVMALPSAPESQAATPLPEFVVDDNDDDDDEENVQADGKQEANGHGSADGDDFQRHCSPTTYLLNPDVERPQLSAGDYAELREAAEQVVLGGVLNRQAALQDPSASAATTPALSPHPSPLLERAPSFCKSGSEQSSRSSSLSVVSMPSMLCSLAPVLTELHLAHNQLTSLKGLERLTLLQYLDVRENKLASLSALACLVTLPAVNQLLLVGNPLAESKHYWMEVLARFTDGGSDRVLVIDGHTPNQKQQAKINALKSRPPQP